MTGEDGATSGFSGGRALLVLCVAGAAIFVALALYGAGGGLRGTDQYWYVDHVRSLASGEGVVTNNVYPVSLYGKTVTLPRPFVHNILNVYAAAALAYLTGAYTAWIALNIICSLLTACLIFLIAAPAAGKAPAMAAGMTYLLLPLTFWQTTQPLAEASIAPLVALAVLLYSRAGDKTPRWFLLAAVCGLLLYCRRNYILVLLAVPPAYLLHNLPARKRTAINAAALVVVAIGLIVLGKALFEPNTPRTYTQILMSSIPGVSDNMDGFFDLDTPTLSVPLLATKLAAGLKTQVLGENVKSLILFYLPFNLIVLGVALSMKKRYLTEPVFIAAAFFFLLHLLSAFVFQNQARYMLTALPPLLAAAGIAAARFDFISKPRNLAIYLAAGILAAAPVSAVLARHAFFEGIKEKHEVSRLDSFFTRKAPPEDAVMVEWPNAKSIKLAYSLRPRIALFVKDGYTREQLLSLAEQAGVKWVVCRVDSRIPESLQKQMQPVAALPEPFENMMLYRFRAPE